MKVAITGHTKGIGLEIVNFFTSKGADILGFSRASGYDISKEEDRSKNIKESKNCQIFVNNAWTIENNGQFHMLKSITSDWIGSNKIIINIGSRASDFTNNPNFPWKEYAKLKKEQDIFCQSNHKGLWILNLKPGSVNTGMSANTNFLKIEPSTISDILDFALINKDNFKIRSITFTK